MPEALTAYILVLTRPSMKERSTMIAGEPHALQYFHAPPTPDTLYKAHAWTSKNA